MITIPETMLANAKANKRPRFLVTLGVDHPEDGRMAALEAGPFFQIVAARDYAMAARGRSAAVLLTEGGATGLVEPYDLSWSEIMADGLPVVGATIDYYTDGGGTYDHVDAY